MFGSYRKLGQSGNVFCVDYKIRAHGCKMFSGFIFTSNNFQKPCLKREKELEHTPHTVQNPYPSSPQPSSSQPRSCRPTVQNPSPSLPSNHFQKKKKKKEPNPKLRRESRAGEIAHTTPDRTTAHNPRSHRSHRTPASVRSHPATCEITPPEAQGRSHPRPTHARSLSFWIYLALSLNCRSLSSSLSLHLTEFLSSMNVLI